MCSDPGRALIGQSVDLKAFGTLKNEHDRATKKALKERGKERRRGRESAKHKSSRRRKILTVKVEVHLGLANARGGNGVCGLLEIHVKGRRIRVEAARPIPIDEFVAGK